MEHVDVVLDLPVDDPVGLEENFTVFPDSDVQQLLRVTSALGSFGRAGEHLFDSLQHMVGATDRIVPSNVVRSRICCDVSANGCDVVALRCVAAAGGPGLWLHRDPDWDSRSTCMRLRSSPAGSGSVHPSRLRRRIKLGHC